MHFQGPGQDSSDQSGMESTEVEVWAQMSTVIALCVTGEVVARTCLGLRVEAQALVRTEEMMWMEWILEACVSNSRSPKRPWGPAQCHGPACSLATT